MIQPTADQRVLRAASRKVSIQIAVVFAATAILGLVTASVFIVHRSQPAEILTHAAGAGRIYLDTSDAVIALVVGSVLGVALAAAVGLLSARSAIKPLGDALASQRRFVQDASHELRTPLAVLDARLQVASRRVEPGSPVARVLEQLRGDSSALTDVVNELLAVSALPDGGRDPTILDAATAVGDIVEELQPLAAHARIRLTCLPSTSIEIRIPVDALRRILSALVDNALAHTEAGGRVDVSVTGAGRNARIRVSDNGHGVTGIPIEQIFDRFAHGHSSGNGRRGFGIGLALVKETTLRYGGEVEVSDTSSRGTTFTLTFPHA